jgi:lipopolysaccharide/colanic/teichoic acid biosynthesis glycosyltransferase
MQRAHNGEYLTAKRVIDVVLAGILLILIIPLLLTIALAIWLESGGPVLYVQPRIGHSGRTFAMLKFRTMRRDRRVRSVPIDFPDRRRALKVRDDPRITHVGRLLRRVSLDELPQLMNVLHGQMSLVGPRPELREVVAEYTPIHYLRHVAPPGITGWWQIHGRCLRPDACHLQEDLEAKFADDLYYLAHRSLSFDLKILLLTIPVVLRGRGAT